MHCWCHTLLCHLYGEMLVPYTAVPSVRCTLGAIHCCAICMVHCGRRTLLCHMNGARLVPNTAVPSVRCTFVAIHCCAISTVHCWCHTLLRHLYVALLVPYIAVPSVCTAELFYYCQCAVLLQPVAHCSELSCLSVSTVLLSAVLFHSIPNFFNSPPKPDTLPHNVLLSTKWRAISVRRVIQRFYSKMIDAAVNYLFSKINKHLIS